MPSWFFATDLWQEGGDMQRPEFEGENPGHQTRGPSKRSLGRQLVAWCRPPPRPWPSGSPRRGGIRASLHSRRVRVWVSSSR